MATKTDKYELRKKEDNDFYNIDDFNDNMDKIETALTEFDDSGSADGITSFTDMLTKLVTGNKLAVTLRNLKAGLQFVLHAGSIVNNCVTDNAKLPLSAAQGKALQDAITKLNSDFGTFYWSGTGNIEILSDKINNWVQDETNFITLPAGRYILGYKAHVQADSSVYIDTSIDTHDSDLPLYEKTMNMPVSCRDNVVFRSVNNVMIYAFTEKTSLYFNAYASASLNVKFKIWATRIK